MQKRDLPERFTIRQPKTHSIPYRFIFVDTETNRTGDGIGLIRHALRLGNALYWKRGKDGKQDDIQRFGFCSASQFWEWVALRVTTKETVYLFAHNATFDFMVLDGFRELPKHGLTLGSVYHKFTTTIIKFSQGKRRLVICDSMNFYPVSLAAVADSLGMEKPKIDYELATEAELDEHCKNDVEIVYRAIQRIVNRVLSDDLGSFRPTISGIAFSAYKHRFMKHRIEVTHYPEVVEHEKNAYVGGFVNVYKLANFDSDGMVKLDVNQMYPSVMRENIYPVRLTEVAKNLEARHLESMLKFSLVVARVKLRTWDAVYPLRVRGEVVYPVGEFVTTLSTPMLKYAIDRGHVLAVEYMTCYAGSPIFSEYVDYMHGKRLDAQIVGDKADSIFYKGMANHLYGKFAQRQTISKRVADNDPSEFAVYDAFDVNTKEMWKELHAGGSTNFIFDGGETISTSYAIAAHVTEYARLKLFEAMALARSAQVYYCDTDSLIVSRKGYERIAHLVDASQIGAFKQEAIDPVFVAWAKKDYLFGEDRRIKGYDETKRQKGKDVFDMINSVKLFGAARRNLAEGAYWIRVAKQHKPFIASAHVSQSGQVSPLTLPQQYDMIGARTETKEIVRHIYPGLFDKRQREVISQYA